MIRRVNDVTTWNFIFERKQNNINIVPWPAGTRQQACWMLRYDPNGERYKWNRVTSVVFSELLLFLILHRCWLQETNSRFPIA